MIKWSSDKVMVTINKFGVHSRHVSRCFHLHYAVLCLAYVNINTLPGYLCQVLFLHFFPYIISRKKSTSTMPVIRVQGAQKSALAITHILPSPIYRGSDNTHTGTQVQDRFQHK